MTHPIKRLPHLLAMAFGIVPAVSAQAQVPLFLDTCVAEAGDLDRLPLVFAKAGLVEVDRAAGPPGPAVAALAPDRRLWSVPGGSGMSEIFAGYSPLGNTPFAVCWIVSRPRLSAADMLVALKRRFPPTAMPGRAKQYFSTAAPKPGRPRQAAARSSLAWNGLLDHHRSKARA